MQPQKSIFQRAAEFLENNWPETLQSGLAASLTTASLLCSDEIAGLIASQAWIKYVQGIAAICVFGLLIGQGFVVYAFHRRRETISALRGEISNLKAEHQQEIAARQHEIGKLRSMREIRALQTLPLIFSYLEHLGLRELEFGTKPHECERLTLYQHDDEAGIFHPLCRFSNSAVLSNVPRNDYGDTEGCLGKVWKHGFYFSGVYPNPDYVEAYIEQSRKDGFPKERVATTRMRARVFCGTVIWNNDETKPIGALLLETSCDRYTASSLNEFMKKQERGHLGALIDALD